MESVSTRIVREAAAGSVGGLVLAIVVAPPLEELLFRAGLIGGAQWLLGHTLLVVVTAAAFSTLLFAVLHLFNYERADRKLWQVAPQLVLGGTCAVLYLYFGLWTAVAVHVAFNVAAFGSACGLLRRELAAAAA